MAVSLDDARAWRDYARFVFPDQLVEGGDEERRILVAEDASGTGCLLVTPEIQARGDVEFIRALIKSKTVGELRGTPSAWCQALELWVDGEMDFMYDGLGDRLDPNRLPVDTAYSVTEWFGEEYEGLLPLAIMRTAQTCPLVVLARHGVPVSADLAAYDVPVYIDDGSREAVEQLLQLEGFTVVHDDVLASSYIS